ncbi:MAG: hypothetical protein LBM38_06530 [Clostridiales bacterium]|jgi:hypothetical protein|nr:hypothetical protein [Clostridiales bacterium]
MKKYKKSKVLNAISGNKNVNVAKKDEFNVVDSFKGKTMVPLKALELEREKYLARMNSPEVVNGQKVLEKIKSLFGATDEQVIAALDTYYESEEKADLAATKEVASNNLPLEADGQEEAAEVEESEVAADEASDAMIASDVVEEEKPMLSEDKNVTTVNDIDWKNVTFEGQDDASDYAIPDNIEIIDDQGPADVLNDHVLNDGAEADEEARGVEMVSAEEGTKPIKPLKVNAFDIGNSSGGGKKKYKLTRQQLAIAAAYGMTPEEYAKYM